MITKKSVKRESAKMNKELYDTLIGSIIVSIGIVNGKSKSDMLKLYKSLKKNKQVLEPYDTVIKLCDYIDEIFGGSELKNRLVLCYDDYGMYSPLVTIADEHGIYPLDKEGEGYGIIKALMINPRDYMHVEAIYEEDKF